MVAVMLIESMPWAVGGVEKLIVAGDGGVVSGAVVVADAGAESVVVLPAVSLARTM